MDLFAKTEKRYRFLRVDRGRQLLVLDEANVLCVELEALTAKVEAVLSDETVVVTAYTARPRAWTIVLWTRVPYLFVDNGNGRGRGSVSNFTPASSSSLGRTAKYFSYFPLPLPFLIPSISPFLFFSHQTLKTSMLCEQYTQSPLSHTGAAGSPCVALKSKQPK